MLRVCIAGITGWTGSAVARAVLEAKDLRLVAGIARSGTAAVPIVPRVEDLPEPADVLVDFTSPDSVKARTLAALERKMRVVIGTSGLTAADLEEIDRAARALGLGVIAAGNFSITAALAKRCAILAAEHLPSWEIVDYAAATKPDAPSGTARELAERLAEVRRCEVEPPVDATIGPREARGTTLGGAQVHSVRLSGFVLAFEAIFGLPHERLTIRHDAGEGAEPYVAGTLLAVRRVPATLGLVRGLDALLFRPR